MERDLVFYSLVLIFGIEVLLNCTVPYSPIDLQIQYILQILNSHVFDDHNDVILQGTFFIVVIVVL